MKNEASGLGSPILKWFRKFSHQPAHVQWISKRLAALAGDLDDSLPAGPEKSAGLRKLLEAKDCFVRAAIEAEESDSSNS